MTLEIVAYVLGQMDNNTYLLADPATKEAVIVDPSFKADKVLQDAKRRGWQVKAVWLTHAHFDHFTGLNALQTASADPLPIGVHEQDLPLYRLRGGADLFNFPMESTPEPEILFEDGQILQVGDEPLKVIHTPGHSPGHVIFYSESAGAAICGDVIFYRSIGRTDLPGSSSAVLLKSIRERVFKLPPDTRLLSGHGPETTVEQEMRENPFV
jgi:hydroxyacylglutathione hydrolase